MGFAVTEAAQTIRLSSAASARIVPPWNFREPRASLTQERARLRIGDDHSRGPTRRQRPGGAEQCDGRHIAGTTIASGPDQHAVRIRAVPGAVTPEEVEVGIEPDPRREQQGRRTLDVARGKAALRWPATPSKV